MPAMQPAMTHMDVCTYSTAFSLLFILSIEKKSTFLSWSASIISLKGGVLENIGPIQKTKLKKQVRITMRRV
uniref:Uncharacterized protein n=1 Tax=Hyaloperonospora arabidopsidis (strain Emoy2) TaxID=559515 RepID=M4B878_HYAAE